MEKTVICHFYNEEFLLPWFLNHHKHIFDHGIMIDYASTDRSADIIKEICPTWEIRPSRNEYFDPESIDQEVMDIERELTGWRIALNVTEFLYGNLDLLDDDPKEKNYFLRNFVFVDMEDTSKGPIELDHKRPLHEQRYWGYLDDKNAGKWFPNGSVARLHRSIHNHPVVYADWGRHWPNTEAIGELVIFYYGYASISKQGIARKTQIRQRISNYINPDTRSLPSGIRFEEDENGQQILVNAEGNQIDKETLPGGWGSHHNYNAEEFIKQYREDQQPLSYDTRLEIAHILEHNKRTIGQEW